MPTHRLSFAPKIFSDEGLSVLLKVQNLAISTCPLVSVSRENVSPHGRLAFSPSITEEGVSQQQVGSYILYENLNSRIEILCFVILYIHFVF